MTPLAAVQLFSLTLVLIGSVSVAVSTGLTLLDWK
jgi:hypothetical protein